MPTEYVLHIGMPKTGSRSLQLAFFENREILRQHGVVYPTAGIMIDKGPKAKHRRLMNVLAGSEPMKNGMTEDWAVNFREETENAEICVFSDQHFYRFPNPELLLSRFPRDRTRVAIYLREPVVHVASRYAHSIKNIHNQTMSLQEFARFTCWSNADILDRWVRIFGQENVAIRRFDRNSLLEEDIVKDFAHLVRPGLEKVFSNQKYFANASLSGNLLFVKRVLNHFIEQGHNLPVYHEMEELKELDPRFRGRFFVDKESVDMIASLFRKDCVVVGKRFGALFEPRDEEIEGPICPDGQNLSRDYDMIRSNAEEGGNLAALMEHLQNVFGF